MNKNKSHTNSGLFQQAKRRFHYQPNSRSHKSLLKSKIIAQQELQPLKEGFSTVKTLQNQNNYADQSSWFVKLVSGIEEHPPEEDHSLLTPNSFNIKVSDCKTDKPKLALHIPKQPLKDKICNSARSNRPLTDGKGKKFGHQSSASFVKNKQNSKQQQKPRKSHSIKQIKQNQIKTTKNHQQKSKESLNTKTKSQKSCGKQNRNNKKQQTPFFLKKQQKERENIDDLSQQDTPSNHQNAVKNLMPLQRSNRNSQPFLDIRPNSLYQSKEEQPKEKFVGSIKKNKNKTDKKDLLVSEKVDLNGHRDSININVLGHKLSHDIFRDSKLTHDIFRDTGAAAINIVRDKVISSVLKDRQNANFQQDRLISKYLKEESTKEMSKHYQQYKQQNREQLIKKYRYSLDHKTSQTAEPLGLNIKTKVDSLMPISISNQVPYRSSQVEYPSTYGNRLIRQSNNIQDSKQSKYYQIRDKYLLLNSYEKDNLQFKTVSRHQQQACHQNYKLIDRTAYKHQESAEHLNYKYKDKTAYKHQESTEHLNFKYRNAQNYQNYSNLIKEDQLISKPNGLQSQHISKRLNHKQLPVHQQHIQRQNHILAGLKKKFETEAVTNITKIQQNLKTQTKNTFFSYNTTQSQTKRNTDVSPHKRVYLEEPPVRQQKQQKQVREYEQVRKEEDPRTSNLIARISNKLNNYIERHHLTSSSTK